MQAVQQPVRQITSPMRKRALIAMEKSRLNDLADQPTQVTGAIKLPLTPVPGAKITQPIPLSELLSFGPVTTGPILPVDDLGRQYYKVSDQGEVNTLKLIAEAVERYHKITDKYPFCVVFCSYMRHLHAYSMMPFYHVPGTNEKIPFLYEEDGCGYDVMARG